ncbi:hypothetical protein IQ07DRAFT_143493 [Pyrenochaeta sp. DS3sAY3a]|nr:hypothetical protein IQ07DRAFT_143493 [Pyrenochaeta sp. DS3sAY3a]
MSFGEAEAEIAWGALERTGTCSRNAGNSLPMQAYRRRPNEGDHPVLHGAVYRSEHAESHQVLSLPSLGKDPRLQHEPCQAEDIYKHIANVIVDSIHLSNEREDQNASKISTYCREQKSRTDAQLYGSSAAHATQKLTSTNARRAARLCR